LTRKNLVWHWSDDCQKSFDELKTKFQEAPIRLMPDNKKPFVVETDASKWATGGVLQQQDSNADWHPCGYISHSFDAAQRNYKIYDHELLSIVRALETWRHSLHGSPFPTVILSVFLNCPKTQPMTSLIEPF